MAHMSKCFQAIEKLKLDTETPAPGTRPKGLGMISCVGDEYVEFSSPLPLEKKVGVGNAQGCSGNAQGTELRCIKYPIRAK
jgi:hypothetical protein